MRLSADTAGWGRQRMWRLHVQRTALHRGIVPLRWAFPTEVCCEHLGHTRAAILRLHAGVSVTGIWEVFRRRRYGATRWVIGVPGVDDGAVEGPRRGRALVGVMKPYIFEGYWVQVEGLGII
jgi:hypothetical protein